jgi:uncharacterized membrane protein
MKRHLQPVLIGLLFLIAGTLHFKNPQWYVRIMPPFIPAQSELVALSGACEILGGFGVLYPRTRRAAGWGLIALLLAVFPANIYMVVDAQKFVRVAPAWALYARLPLQFVLCWWVYRACVLRKSP